MTQKWSINHFRTIGWQCSKPARRCRPQRSTFFSRERNTGLHSRRVYCIRWKVCNK